ncbi:hypothetical protein PMAYCL1PPCAC_33102, partial [Pristionchus mayeri]
RLQTSMNDVRSSFRVDDYIPKNEEERRLIELFEAELKIATNAKESAKKQTAQYKKQLESEWQKQNLAAEQKADLERKFGRIEQRVRERKLRAEEVINAINKEVEKKTVGSRPLQSSQREAKAIQDSTCDSEIKTPEDIEREAEDLEEDVERAARLEAAKKRREKKHGKK